MKIIFRETRITCNVPNSTFDKKSEFLEALREKSTLAASKCRKSI